MSRGVCDKDDVVTVGLLKMALCNLLTHPLPRFAFFLAKYFVHLQDRSRSAKKLHGKPHEYVAL